MLPDVLGGDPGPRHDRRHHFRVILPPAGSWNHSHVDARAAGRFEHIEAWLPGRVCRPRTSDDDPVAGPQLPGRPNADPSAVVVEHRMAVGDRDPAVVLQPESQQRRRSPPPEQMADRGEARLARGGIHGQCFQRVGHRHVHLANPVSHAGRRGFEQLAERQDPNLGPVADTDGLLPAQAMAAEPGARIEGRVAERLGLGRLDDLPDVDAHRLERHLQLVHERDVHRAIRVLQDLDGLSGARGRDAHDAVQRAPVERLRQPRRLRTHAAHDLGDRARRILRVARILALGAEGQEHVGLHLQSGGLQPWAHHLLGRSRIGRRLEDHELARPQAGGDGVGRLLDVRQVRLALGRQRRGNADEDRVGLGQAREVGGGVEAPALEGALDARGRDVGDVGLAPLEPRDLVAVDVETEDRETAAVEFEQEGKAHVAEADDPHARGLAVDRRREAPRGFDEGFGHHRGFYTLNASATDVPPGAPSRTRGSCAWSSSCSAPAAGSRRAASPPRRWWRRRR